MTVTIESANAHDFTTDARAVVLEDDTAMVLGARRDIIRPVDDHPIRIMTSLYEEPPRQPGGLEIRGTRPFLLHALVHDFDQEPSFREEWVREALPRVLAASEARLISTMPW